MIGLLAAPLLAQALLAHALLAHEGGWDEILLVLVPIVVIGGLLVIAKRRVERAAIASSPGLDHAPADGPADGPAGGPERGGRAAHGAGGDATPAPDGHGDEPATDEQRPTP